MQLKKTIAELCWYYNAWHYRADDKTTKLLVVHLSKSAGENISEAKILEIMGSPGYFIEVENLIRTTRSTAERDKWIERWRKKDGDNMYKKFGKRMGLSETNAKKLIKKYE